MPPYRPGSSPRTGSPRSAGRCPALSRTARRPDPSTTHIALSPAARPRSSPRTGQIDSPSRTSAREMSAGRVSLEGWKGTVGRCADYRRVAGCGVIGGADPAVGQGRSLWPACGPGFTRPRLPSLHSSGTRVMRGPGRPVSNCSGWPLPSRSRARGRREAIVQPHWCTGSAWCSARKQSPRSRGLLVTGAAAPATSAFWCTSPRCPRTTWSAIAAAGPAGLGRRRRRGHRPGGLPVAPLPHHRRGRRGSEVPEPGPGPCPTGARRAAACRGLRGRALHLAGDHPGTSPGRGRDPGGLRAGPALPTDSASPGRGGAPQACPRRPGD